MPEVYLAGPIEGCTEKERNDWRDKATKILSDVGITAYFPDDAVIEDRYHEHAIFHKDLFQIDQCKIVLANLKAMNGKTFGTPFEMGYAHAKGKFIVVVGKSNQLDHPFVTMGAAPFKNLSDALIFITEELRNV